MPCRGDNSHWRVVHNLAGVQDIDQIIAINKYYAQHNTAGMSKDAQQNTIALFKHSKKI